MVFAFRLAVSNAILNITSYTQNKWIGVFTKFFVGKIMAPPVVTINPVHVGNTTSIQKWYWNMIYRFWSIGSTITPSYNSENRPTKLLYMTAYPIFQHKNNRYIFLEFHGEKIVNGTKYSVTIMPTAREGIVEIIVTIGDHT